ncbi:TIGR03087 family PEP-CTERM/XrtA system glycosyltransferase [Sphingomonas endolithica]|uniref:TIGR03087 family PEP-CTERM/XrtA system glycosyltransferase n=1 Tax=Sphingomonas endolithica TaxID=2972485 RepID=UPI0021AEF1D9|nr:TIGR03087 family PEP-CTERM/XrtA system glycosyltransferase [Sphingomonas sp. ZFBP2030]
MGDILFLAHRVPYPPDRGDKIRGFNILNFLAARRRVHLIAFADDPKDLQHDAALALFADSRSVVRRSKSRTVAAVQALLRRKPVSLTAFDDAQVHAAVAAMLEREDIEAIYVFSGQMAQYLPWDAKPRVIMDFVDMDSAKFAAYGAGARGPKVWMMRREARLLGSFERDVAARVDASLFVSESEAALFRQATGVSQVFAVENGVDTAFFDPSAAFDRPAKTGPLIVFTGQMDYAPNVEAVRWFAGTIFPIILTGNPDARFTIVGRAPTDAVTALGALPGVCVTGEVADVRGWLSAASVVVAPLKLARGVQNKVLEAMAMARPVVASEAAAEGIDHGGTIRVGATADEIAAEISALLADAHAAERLGHAARARVQQRYSWAARLAPLETIMGVGAAPPLAERSAA